MWKPKFADTRACHRKIFDQLFEVHILCALMFDADLRSDLPCIGGDQLFELDSLFFVVLLHLRTTLTLHFLSQCELALS